MQAHQRGRPPLLKQLCQQGDATPCGGLVPRRTVRHAGDVHEVVSGVELRGSEGTKTALLCAPASQCTQAARLRPAAKGAQLDKERRRGGLPGRTMSTQAPLSTARPACSGQQKPTEAK